MIIKQGQLTDLAWEWERSKRAEYVERIRKDLPAETSSFTREELDRQVEQGCSAAGLLGIKTPEHVFRFLRLRYLPEAVWQRAGAQQLLLQVLAETSVDPDRRLRFIEKAIAPKDSW